MQQNDYGERAAEVERCDVLVFLVKEYDGLGFRCVSRQGIRLGIHGRLWVRRTNWKENGELVLYRVRRVCHVEIGRLSNLWS